MSAIHQLPVFQDHIQFSLKAEKTVVNDTVKIVTGVNVLITDPNQTEEGLRTEIRATLNRFIKAEWQFSNMQRFKDQSGFERLTLSASTRVSETENHSLNDRAAAAGRTGLQITNVFADTTIPTSLLDDAESELRGRILAMAKKQAEEFHATDGEHHWRVSNIDFRPESAPTLGGRKGVLEMAATTYGSGFAHSEENGLGNAQKITMFANVVLSAFVLDPRS